MDKHSGEIDSNTLQSQKGSKIRPSEKQSENTLDHSSHGHSAHIGFLSGKAELLFAMAAGCSVGAGYLLSFYGVEFARASVVFYFAAYFFGGFFAALETVEDLRAERFKIDSLMIVAAVGAGVLGEWLEGALLLTLFSIGHSLEHFAMGKAKRAIEALAALAPTSAHRLRDGKATEIRVEDLAVGDVVLIKANERIPVDGVVIKGGSAVNQAPVTGESMPVEKSAIAPDKKSLSDFSKIEATHRVFAGTINGVGVLEVSVSKLSSESTLARVAKMVAEAQGETSPTQQLTDKIERFFVPAVFITVTLLLFAFTVIDETFAKSLYRAMAVLVAASPCALAIATPSAVLSGIARAGRSGVLIKSGAALETLGQVKAMAFDKTGTLTEGKPKVTDVFVTSGGDSNALLSYSAALESGSDHPLAKAVIHGAEERLGSKNFKAASGIESLTGIGISGHVDGKSVLIARPGYFEQTKQIAYPAEIRDEVARLQENGRTVVVVAIDQSVAGAVGIMDTVRDTARKALEALKASGIEKTVMLSGDNQKVASAVAGMIGLTDALGDLMPEDKVTTIKALREKHLKVAMVGDGANDAPALAAASVGIAMGAAGSDVALEAADVALMTDDLLRLSFAVSLSKKASSIIKQNLWISLGMVAILIPATMTGLGIGPAVLMHEGSTLVVVLNALRLLSYKSEF